MHMKLKAVRVCIIGLMAASLSCCSPTEVKILACAANGHLAFWIEDTKGWIFNSAPRPYSVHVYEPFAGSRWETRVPYDLVGNALHTYQSKRKTVQYGQLFDGWEVPTPAHALVSGKTYHVQIWTDGGRGMLEMSAGLPIPDCKTVRSPR
jgi:hypothetical protein